MERSAVSDGAEEGRSIWTLKTPKSLNHDARLAKTLIHLICICSIIRTSIFPKTHQNYKITKSDRLSKRKYHIPKTRRNYKIHRIRSKPKTNSFFINILYSLTYSVISGFQAGKKFFIFMVDYYFFCI